MAPEILRGSDSYDKSVDVYSFALIMYYTFTGAIPFADVVMPPWELSNSIISGKRPSIPESCPAKERKIIEKCWNVTPNQRPTFDKIQAFLKSYYDELTAESKKSMKISKCCSYTILVLSSKDSNGPALAVNQVIREDDHSYSKTVVVNGDQCTLKVFDTGSKMMSYFQKTEQTGYFRYVHILYNENMASETPGYVEAACTLLLHAYKLPWTDELLPQMIVGDKTDPLPAEKSWERRKRLYYMAINCFDQSRLYERSLELYKELADQYRKHGEFALLSTLLQEEAKEYEELDAASFSRVRVLPTFFLICYSEFGFPVSVAGRRFVQRADTHDTAEGVASRLKVKFPDVEIRTSVEVINLDKLAGETKVVVILPLRPSSEDEAAGFDTLFPPKMPPATRQYQLFNNTRVFTEPQTEAKDEDEVRHFSFGRCFYCRGR